MTVIFYWEGVRGLTYIVKINKRMMGGKKRLICELNLSLAYVGLVAFFF